MRTHSDDFDLAAELRSLRPPPHPEFRAELDSRVATGFRPDPDKRPGVHHRITEAFWRVPARRFAGLAGVTALLAIAVSTALISVSGPRGDKESRRTAQADAPRRHGSNEFAGHPKVTGRKHPSESSLAGGASAPATTAPEKRAPHAGAPHAGYQYSLAPSSAGESLTSSRRHRDVERGAELVLRSEPGRIEENARQVFAAVRAAGGIVLDSSVHDWTANAGGHAGEARAGFKLLIPSTRLGDAMATLSRIAPVRSRHESTSDITAPTVALHDRLRASEAKAESLLAQLASAGSEEERLAAEARLRRERRHGDALRNQLNRLHARAYFSRVTLRIEGRSAAGFGATSWGVGDALSDGGRILAVAAGVVVIGLAVAGPPAILCLIAWLTSRAWARRRRERALG